jgi:hypothetical protein
MPPLGWRTYFRAYVPFWAKMHDPLANQLSFMMATFLETCDALDGGHRADDIAVAYTHPGFFVIENRGSYEIAVLET